MSICPRSGPLSLLLVAATLLSSQLPARPSFAQDQEPARLPATQPVGKLPHLEVDVRAQEVRVACEALDVDAPLEFFAVVTGTNEHEALLRSPVLPSHLHLALVMLGLEPGEPVRYVEAAERWLPPQGPPLHIEVEYARADGQLVRLPAHRWMRNVRNEEPMPPLTWVFVGSRMMPDGNYAADVTGYLVSVVNFDLTVIDIPQLASNANETLEWECNPDAAPPRGTKVTMILSPAGATEAPATQPAAAEQAALAEPDAPIDMPLVVIDGQGALTVNDKSIAPEALTLHLLTLKAERPVHVRLSAAPEATARVVSDAIAAVQAADVPLAIVPPGELEHLARPASATGGHADNPNDPRLAALRARWEQAVAPHGQALRAAAQTHYEVIATLRREQQHHINEADRIQRLIDELEKQYQDLTTPRPAANGR